MVQFETKTMKIFQYIVLPILKDFVGTAYGKEVASEDIQTTYKDNS